MKTKKSRVVLSSVSVLLVLSLLAGMTMAWFTDTEKVNANFTAGVLDISVKPGDTDEENLTFENLRPMLYDNFYKELDPNGDEKWDNDVTQDGTTDLEDSDYAPVPAYFKPVVIKNEGTLPAKVKLSLEAGDGCEAGEPILTEDNITIKQDPEKMQACANRLAPVLKVFVYKLVDGTWTKVEDVNLNTAYDEAKANPDKVASDNTAKETNNTYMTAMLPAQGTATYVIAGYLPETVNNAYQGQHFHSKLVLNAYQMDDTGAGKPDEGGSSSTDPEDPDRFNENVTIEWREETAEGDLVKSQNETVKSDTTIAAVNYDAPEGYEYSPEAAEQKTDVVVDEKTGEATPGKVIFTVVPEETKNVEITVKYEATFDTENETDDREVKTATISLAAPGEYTLVTGNTVQGRAARSNGDEPKEITIPAPPAGFAYDPAGQTVSVQIDAEGNVTPEEIIFKVRSEEANVVIRYVDQALVGTDQAIVGSYTDTVEATIGQEYIYSTDTPVVKDHLPEGYEFPTPGVSVKITYLDDFRDEDNTVDGKRAAYVMFMVKKTSTDPEEPENPDDCPYPHIIHNQEELSLVDKHMGHNFILANDITLTGNWKVLGLGTDDDIPLTGTFDGNNHTISGLNVSKNGYNRIGLFALNQGTIKNLKLDEPHITSSNSEIIGGVVGDNKGMISNCHVEGGSVEANANGNNYTLAKYVGGLAGQNGSSGTITCSSSSAYVKGLKYVGGLAGANFGQIDQSYATGNINTTIADATLMNNAVFYLTNYRYFMYSQVGGLVGENSLNGVIRNCYATNSLKAFDYVGGICGTNYGQVIDSLGAPVTIYYPNNYQVGWDTYTADAVHSSVGTNLDGYGTKRGTLSGTYSTVMDNLPYSPEGNRGANVNSVAALHKASTYSGWDTSIWNLQDGDYPDLIHNPR